MTEYVNIGDVTRVQRQSTVVFNEYASLFDNLLRKLLTAFSCLIDGVAVGGKRVEIQYLFKIRLKSRDVGCHLRLENNNVADYECRNQNRYDDELYNLSDFHNYLHLVFGVCRMA